MCRICDEINNENRKKTEKLEKFIKLVKNDKRFKKVLQGFGKPKKWLLKRRIKRLKKQK